MKSFFNLRRTILILSIVFLATAIWYSWQSILEANAPAFIEQNTLNTDLLNKKDTDGDGLADWEEVLYGSNPNIKDTDGDGVNDGEEVLNGTDPTTYGEFGQTSGEVLSQDNPYETYEFEQIQQNNTEEGLLVAKPINNVSSIDTTQLKNNINSLALVLAQHQLTTNYASTTEEFSALYSQQQKEYSIVKNQISQMNAVVQNVALLETNNVLLEAMTNEIATSYLTQVKTLEELLNRENISEEELETLADTYSAAAEQWVSSVVAIHHVTTSAQIVFNANEAGYMFMFQQ